MKLEGAILFFKRFNSMIADLIGFSFVAMMAFIVLNVILRYIFRSPLAWPIEISEYLLVFGVFLPTCYTLLEGGHIEIDMFVSRVSRKARIWLKMSTSGLALVYTIPLTWQATELAVLAYQNSWLSETGSRIPLYPVYSAVPVGCLLVSLGFIVIIAENILQLLRERGNAQVNRGT
jgi:TRAP-type C4-dicarboxylate transport system permease small subunit